MNELPERMNRKHRSVIGTAGLNKGPVGEGISNEEAAERLELCNPNQYVPSDCQGPETDKDDEAHERGAAALRRIGPLEEENEELKKRRGAFLRFLIDRLQLHISHEAFTMIKDEMERQEEK